MKRSALHEFNQFIHWYLKSSGRERTLFSKAQFPGNHLQTNPEIPQVKLHLLVRLDPLKEE